MKRRGFLLLALLLWGGTACRGLEFPPVPPVTPTALSAPPDEQPGAAATTPADAPTEPASAAPVEGEGATPPLTPASRPALFAHSPDDRSVYAGGLTAAAQAALDELPGAPVYHIEVRIDDDLILLAGRQTVFYTNQEDAGLEAIYFHLHPNLLDSFIYIGGVLVDGEPVETELSGQSSSILRVPLPRPLAPGEATVLDMEFEVDVATDIGRNYGVLAYSEGILALAHFYPMLAVYDDEGWNIVEADTQGDLTYSDAAFYLARVTAPADTVLVGSGAIIAEEADGETQSVTFALGPARDFYLAAGDFAVASETVGETTVNSYAPASQVDGAKAALDVAVAALAFQGERVGAYPYTELDIVTTPTSALGIEYPGLIAGTLRMYDVTGEAGSAIPMSAILESTTAHEVAHQWFYNLIGNDQLDEPWLDEALASYWTYRYYLDRYGQAAADAYFQNFTDRWARVGNQPIPVGRPVAAYDGAEYSAVVYGRGAIFVRELEETMGRDSFDAFLRAYAERYRWAIATTEDFRALAEVQCACDLATLFNEWIYE